MKNYFLIFILGFHAVLLFGSPISDSIEKKDPNFDHAEFIGGDDSLFRYIYAQTIYPREAELAEEEGTVEVRFTVDTTGHIKNVYIVNPVSPSLDSEAYRVIANMPPWKPGILDGKRFEVSYTLPVNFYLKPPNQTNGKSIEFSKTIKNDFSDYKPYLPLLYVLLFITIFVTYKAIKKFYFTDNS